MIEEESKVDILIDIDNKQWLDWHTEDQWHNLLHEITSKVINNYGLKCKSEISFLLTNDEEIQQLNKQYRKKDKPTNVLSFPCYTEEEISILSKRNDLPVMLGDIALALNTIIEESKAENKNFLNHFYHLVVHGMLHLLGYDHEDDTEAEHMQQKEISILKELSVNNPYQ